MACSPSTPGGSYLSPQTLYGSAGSFELELIPNVGPTIDATEYNTFGSVTPGYCEVGPNDFLMVFFLPARQTFSIGDQIAIREGSVTLATAFSIPTNAVTEIVATDDNGEPLTELVSVPEPSTVLLGAIGTLGMLRRRR